MSDKEHAREEYEEHEVKFEEERMYPEREHGMRYDGMRAKSRGYGMRDGYGDNNRGEEGPRYYQRSGGNYRNDDKNYGGYMGKNNYYGEPRYRHSDNNYFPYHDEEHEYKHAYKYGGYPPHGGRRGYIRDMMGMDGFTGFNNWFNRPKVNNFFRGVGLLTVGVILAPTLAKVLRPLAVSTVQGAMGIVDDVKGIVDDAKDEVEDIFAEAKWEDEHDNGHQD